jgi:hypothetical protein
LSFCSNLSSFPTLRTWGNLHPREPSENVHRGIKANRDLVDYGATKVAQIPASANKRVLRALRGLVCSDDCSLAGDGELFFELLLLEQAGVIAIESQQFFMPAKLHDAAVIEDRDLVGIAYGRDAVRDDYGG